MNFRAKARSARWLVRFEFPSAGGVGGVEGVLEGVVHVVEGHLVAEVDARLDEDVAVGETGESVRGGEGQADGVRARLRLDHVLCGPGQQVKVFGPVDGGDDRIAGGGEVQQVLLAGHVAAPVQRVVDPGAARQGLLPEGVVLLLVVQHGTAVTDDHHVEGVHQPGGVQGVAQATVKASRSRDDRKMSSSQ